MKFFFWSAAIACVASAAFVAGCGANSVTAPTSIGTEPPPAGTATPQTPAASASIPGATATPGPSGAPSNAPSAGATPAPSVSPTTTAPGGPTPTPGGPASPTPVATLTPGSTPRPSPTPTMAPLGTVQVLPPVLYVNGLGASTAKTLTIDETAYILLFQESDTCDPASGQIASVSPTSGAGPTLMATVTGVKAGTCVVTWRDILGDEAASTVYVTTSAAGVNARVR